MSLLFSHTTGLGRVASLEMGLLLSPKLPAPTFTAITRLGIEAGRAKHCLQLTSIGAEDGIQGNVGASLFKSQKRNRVGLGPWWKKPLLLNISAAVIRKHFVQISKARNAIAQPYRDRE